MVPVRYEEAPCKAALNRVEGMTFRWSLNPYQGCVHGCHYCYARRYHGFRELGAGEDFSSIVFVRTGIAQVLRQELRSPSWKREQVALGTATDPYQPIEGRYRLTRACLEALADHRTPVAIVTKGTLIVRDLDVLQRLTAAAVCSVVFSITTLDLELWHKLEPGTPPPQQRLKALERLSAAGVRAGVMLAPVLPGLTDSPSNLESVVRAAADHGAKFLGTQVVYLMSGTREHFLGFLQSEFPELLDEYRRLFPGPYAPKRFQYQVEVTVDGLKKRHAIAEREEVPEPPRPFQQLALAL